MSTDRVLDAPFVPRRGRLMATGMAAAALLIFGLVALLIPGPSSGGSWEGGDRFMMLGLGVLMAALLSRWALIRAVPRSEGLSIRNLMITRTIPWSEIVDVTFPEGDPWVSLELQDTDVVAVMAVQRADGDLGRSEADRLGRLVDARRAAGA
ncbi:MAG TPA: PH domain-containing protein [Dermatophilaceae bacterium]|nr:PH domain-containing protein [Dermatophilaceae bacterium]